MRSHYCCGCFVFIFEWRSKHTDEKLVLRISHFLAAIPSPTVLPPEEDWKGSKYPMLQSWCKDIIDVGVCIFGWRDRCSSSTFRTSWRPNHRPPFFPPWRGLEGLQVPHLTELMQRHNWCGCWVERSVLVLRISHFLAAEPSPAVPTKEEKKKGYTKEKEKRQEKEKTIFPSYLLYQA